MTLTDVAAFIAIGFLLTLLGYFLFRWASRVRVEPEAVTVHWPAPTPGEVIHVDGDPRAVRFIWHPEWGRSYISDVWNAVGNEVDGLWR